jgi:hypothetical protein
MARLDRKGQKATKGIPVNKEFKEFKEYKVSKV